jgi:dipeptidyl-peptidase-4
VSIPEASRPVGDDQLADLARAFAATQRGTLGRPRAFVLSTDGDRLCYLRALDRADPRQALWLADSEGEPRLLVDPRDLGAETTVADDVLALRERTREQASGITAFAATPDLTMVTFVHDAVLHVVSTVDGVRRTLDVPGPVVDPRPSPTGTHVAWVAGGALRVIDLADGRISVLAADDDPDVSWGLAEFIAAEELGRLRGWWWAPDGRRIAACRVDTGPVTSWWLHEPIAPASAPRMVRYPGAGTANADVQLAVIDLNGSRTDVVWDRGTLPYLTAVRWQDGAPLTLAVQRRDQRRVDVLRVDEDGSTRTLRSITAEPWVELVPGVPCWTPDGRLVTVEDDPLTDTRHVMVDGDPRTPTGLYVDRVLATRDMDLVLEGSANDPTATVLWQVPYDEGRPRPLTPLTGVRTGVVAGPAMVVHSDHAHDTSSHTELQRDGVVVATLPEVPIELPLQPQPIFATLGRARLHAALLLPSWYRDGALPVLLDPYGGPHARRVRQAARSYLVSQWFAEAGFAVLVIDGRGSPGRGLTWEHAVHRDLATPPLEDQVTGLAAATEQWSLLDTARVAIRGWSFGGYLAALAVLRRPDVFHAAIAGAPVTDWRLYDTHYTERYLGDPAADPVAYEHSSLLADAPGLSRPLLLLHGMSDDNVVAAHTLRLSQALLAAGRPHTLLPLASATHVTRDPDQQAGLLRVQLDFLRTSLGVSPHAAVAQ